ncbi:MAG TPA: hypothetical protein VHO50_07320 [Bacteroidales bacterium]|nr:hypothetical protein [Bacteroidales bacterium]
MFSFSCFVSAYGQPFRQFAGAGEAGMGYACIMKSSFWASFHNPANLAGIRKITAGINYDDRYRINELGTKTAAIAVPFGKTSLGAIYSHFGYTDYSRQMAAISCGLPLSENILAGVQIDYYSEKTWGEYEDTQQITFETGLTAHLNKNVIIAIHAYNPVPQSLRKSFMPSALRAGSGIILDENVFAGAEIEMHTGSRPLLRTGIEYEALKKLFLRCGFCTENTSFSFGTGYALDFMKIDLAFSTHERLGITSSASLIFIIK